MSTTPSSASFLDRALAGLSDEERAYCEFWIEASAAERERFDAHKALLLAAARELNDELNATITAARS